MNKDILNKELQFKAVRSGKPGGQHVNKVSTKIQVSVDIKNSKAFTEQEKVVLLEKLKNRLSKSGIFTLSVEDSRSQYMNKKLARETVLLLFEKALKKKKKRIATKPKKSAVLKRLQKKKQQALKKQNRRKDFL